MSTVAGKLFGTIIRPEEAIAGVAAHLPECSISAWKHARKLAPKRNFRSGT